MNVRKGAAILLSGVMMWGAAVYLPQYSSVLNNSIIDAKADSYKGPIQNNGLGGITIDISKPPYSTFDYNNYKYSQVGCAWFASARVNDLTGKGNVVWGSSNWWNYGPDYGFTPTQTPTAPAIICWGGNDINSDGHVAILEKIEGDTAYISEGGYVWEDSYNNSYCRIYTVNVNSIKNASFTIDANKVKHYYPLLGYLSLGTPVDPRPIGPEMEKGAGQTIPDGNYWINSSMSPSLFIDPAPGNDVPAASGANVATWDYGDTLPPAADVWTIKYLNNGFYSITQMGTKMSLDVTGSEKYSETNLQMYQLWGDNNAAQQWSIKKTDKGYTIQSRCNSFFVDSQGGIPEPSNIFLYQGNGGSGQAFNFIPYVDKLFKGNGTAASPYQISSADDMRKLADLINNENTAQFFRNKYYVQTADIDLGDELFTPIGTKTDGNPSGGGFNGIYDGKCHKVTGLNVDRKMSYNGLFGWCYGGTIKNVSVYGSVNGNSPTGGIVGEIGTTTLSSVVNCSFNGDVVSKTGTAGGIVGHIWLSGKVENCYFNGSIKSEATDPNNANTGGIIGVANAGNEGGGATVTLKNCYAVSSSTVKGGAIGLFSLKHTASKLDSSNNLFLKSMSSKGINGDASTGCAGLTEELMKESAAELLGEPFVENTSSGEKLINDGYPIFSWQAPAYEFKGDGTDESPYLITSKKELEIFRDLTNDELRYSEFNKKSFKLTTDIDLAGEKWTPIAKRLFNGTDKGMYFCGHFDGANHTITGLNVNEKSKFAGLFGSISSGAIVENLAVEGKVVNTTLSTGGVVGELCLDDPIVRNCCFIGDVTGADEAVGGVVGYLYQDGRVQNCYHIGTVTCPEHSCGGVVGKAVNETAKTKALIENCYHVGKLTGTTGTVVGMIGEKAENGAYVEVKNCFGLTTDGKLCAGGEGKTFDAMQCTESVMKKSAALLGDAFVTNPDATVINGYPIFTWQDKTNPGTSESNVVYGDSNGDDNVDLSDAVLIMQTLSNPSKFKLTDQGRINADCYNVGDGVTNADALAIQKYKLSLITELPEKK